MKIDKKVNSWSGSIEVGVTACDPDGLELPLPSSATELRRGSWIMSGMNLFCIPYAHHYKPRLVYFFTPFFTAVYILQRLVSQTIYVLLNEEILQFLSLKSAVYNQERVIMARGRYIFLTKLGY